MNSAIRRHHYRRLQKKRRFYWGGPAGRDPRYTYLFTESERLGKVANTPHPCSCIGGCGHMRKAYGPKIQERRFFSNTKLDGV